MKRIDKLFEDKERKIFSVFLTAGYPTLEATADICVALAEEGVDCIEIGLPFSDPIADGPVIQRTSQVSIANGTTIDSVFLEVTKIRKKSQIPLILMGYINPVLQYGIENFLRMARESGVDGVIIPDLPPEEYIRHYRGLFEQYGIQNILLISPNTSDARILQLDEISSGYLYCVSTLGVTGGGISDSITTNLERISALPIRNPLVVGFGVKTKEDFKRICSHASGAIIGSAFLDALAIDAPVETARKFARSIR